MSPVDRSPGDRSKPSVGSALRSAARIAAGGHRREDEILRQLTDVFSELTRLSAQVSGVQAAIDEMNSRLEHLVSAVDTEIDTHVQTTQLLGRLLESARARLEVLEEAMNGPG